MQKGNGRNPEIKGEKMSLLKNILTFGAHGRIERKLEEFEDLRMEYEGLYAQMERKRATTNHTLEQVIKVKMSAVESLKKINRISQNLKGKEREILFQQVGNDIINVQFDLIEETISAADTAMNVTKGVSAGVGTALGAWALVSTLGTASTGAAIGSLSGVAATNATLAWFGGGALAAGGGGMAAGTAVLGGIVMLPALVLTGIFSHIKASKQIQEIERKMLDVLKTIDQIHENVLQMELIEKRSKELIIAIEKFQETFQHEIEMVYKQIYPIPFLSQLMKSFKKYVLRRNYFSDQDLQHISYIGGIATEFAVLIDTKVFE